MTDAGSPGARCMSTNATVATTSATGISASNRRARYVFTRATYRARRPQKQLGRHLEAFDLRARHVELGVVAELDAPDVLVEEGLDPLPHRPPLLRVDVGHEPLPALVLLLEAPPAGPVAVHRGGEPGLVG